MSYAVIRLVPTELHLMEARAGGRRRARKSARPWAFADDRVKAVIAQTLPEHNASNRVLEKAGFQNEGEAQEGSEGVWRFSLTRTASGARAAKTSRRDDRRRAPTSALDRAAS